MRKLIYLYPLNIYLPKLLYGDDNHRKYSREPPETYSFTHKKPSKKESLKKTPTRRKGPNGISFINKRDQQKSTKDQ